MSSLDDVIFVLDKSKKLEIVVLWLVFLMKYSAKRTSVNRTIIDTLSLYPFKEYTLYEKTNQSKIIRLKTYSLPN